MECRGVLAPRSKALQSQTRTAKKTKRAAISESGSGMLHGGVERGQPRSSGAARFRLLSWFGWGALPADDVKAYDTRGLKNGRELKSIRRLWLADWDSAGLAPSER